MVCDSGVNDSLSHLLSTNVEPSSIEAATIQHQIDLADSELALICNQLAKLRTKREQLERYRIMRIGVLPSIRRLPPDILGEILLHAVPELGPGQNNIVDLLLVCRAWAFAAYSTPRLWSSIRCFAGPTSPTLGSIMNTFEHWFRRSGSLLLDLSLFVNQPLGGSSPSCLEALLPVAQRFKTLKLDLPDAIYFSPLIRPVVQAANAEPIVWENLESLELEAHGSDIEPVVNEEQFTMGLMPRLTNVTIAVDGTFLIDRLELPWAQLTTLDLRSFDAHLGVLSILQQCQNLVSCYLTFGINQDDDLIFLGGGVTLPKLERLQVCVDTFSEGPSYFLDPLTTPALKDLSIELVCDGGSCSARPVSSLIERSRCILSSLDLRHLEMAQDDLEELLRMIPSLEDFGMSSLTSDASFLVQIEEQNALPNLHTINLHLSYDNASRDDFVAFMKGRWWIDEEASTKPRERARLQEASLTFFEPVFGYPDFVGLDVSIDTMECIGTTRASIL